MFSAFKPADYSSIDVQARLESIMAKRENLVERTGKSWEELEFLLAQSRMKSARQMTTPSLIEIILAANSQKRNTFTEHFLLKDLDATHAVVRFEGGQINSNDDYPGCVLYDDYPGCVLHDSEAVKELSSQDIQKFKLIADSCGVRVYVKEVATDALADKLVLAGFEEYEDSFEYGDFRIHHKATRVSRM